MKKPKKRRARAIELFGPKSPFKLKVVKSKKVYNRKPRTKVKILF
jgi:hypothetical protein